MGIFKKTNEILTRWLMDESYDLQPEIPIVDFDRLKFEVKPCDIILVEGRNRVSSVIKYFTESPWSHACMYIGRLHDIEDPNLRNVVKQHFSGDEATQLIIESYLGKGTVVNTLDEYQNHHVRICRPDGLTYQDSQKVVGYMINALGIPYNVRHIVDLLRFLLPWRLFPRRWGSSLFTETNDRGARDSEICSSLLAHAFASVKFPILPSINLSENNQLKFRRRNPKLFVPKDFDYSPYFKIIKYPILEDSPGKYQNLRWDS